MANNITSPGKWTTWFEDAQKYYKSWQINNMNPQCSNFFSTVCHLVEVILFFQHLSLRLKILLDPCRPTPFFGGFDYFTYCYFGFDENWVPLIVPLKNLYLSIKTFLAPDFESPRLPSSSFRSTTRILSTAFPSIDAILHPMRKPTQKMDFSKIFFYICCWIFSEIKIQGLEIVKESLRTSANGHIMLNAPVLVRSLKLSSIEPC